MGAPEYFLSKGQHKASTNDEEKDRPAYSLLAIFEREHLRSARPANSEEQGGVYMMLVGLRTANRITRSSRSWRAPLQKALCCPLHVSKIMIMSADLDMVHKRI